MKTGFGSNLDSIQSDNQTHHITTNVIHGQEISCGRIEGWHLLEHVETIGDESQGTDNITCWWVNLIIDQSDS